MPVWEKSTQAQEVAGRIFGAVAGELLHQAYQVPIIKSHLLHLNYLPFASRFPLPYYFLSFHIMVREFFVLGTVVISKNFLRTRKIMVMHSNERGECCLCTIIDRSGSVDAT